MKVTKQYTNIIEIDGLSLTFVEYSDGRTNGGYWLYDKTQSMNLSMRAKTEQAALLECIAYYQKRLSNIESIHFAMQSRLHAFMAGEGWEEIDQDKNDFCASYK